MSNAIRYDSFLVHHLARELDADLRAKTVSALQFDSAEQRVLFDVADIRFVWDLHANTGTLTRTAPLYPLPDTAILPRKARVTSVSAFHDERVVSFELAGERRENATYTVVIELLTNQWNAFALDHAGKVLRVLKLRETGRSFRRGQNYQPPEHPDAARQAFRSPLNEALDDAQFQRMLAEAPLPAVVDGQPYPHHLWRPDVRRFDTLLSAFAVLAGADTAETLVQELERRLRSTTRKIERLSDEMQKAAEAEQQTRSRADVLIAYATTVTKGVSRVVLPGFEGGDVVIDLDPKLSAIDNAQVLYREARKHDRAVR
ncbi:MAG TPA: NFACT family protein, partial [Longimicrobiales bacterium]